MQKSNTNTCTPSMTVVPPKTSAGEFNAVCVAVVDHGDQATPWGVHPRISLVFETDAKDEHGNPQILTRTYNNYPYSRSALTLEIKNWLGHDISKDSGDWKVEDSVGEQASLKTFIVAGMADKHYAKIETVNPAGAAHVQPSGFYQPKENN